MSGWFPIVIDKRVPTILGEWIPTYLMWFFFHDNESFFPTTSNYTWFSWTHNLAIIAILICLSSSIFIGVDHPLFRRCFIMYQTLSQIFLLKRRMKYLLNICCASHSMATIKQPYLIALPNHQSVHLKVQRVHIWRYKKLGDGMIVLIEHEDVIQIPLVWVSK